ncbi:hypothetical protein N7539_008693 [Penicillium diatomitis]|uniref:Uncharacterized protein n=1 Tax=Penicillium diatomitis TaxID=2819901 RepID=A0A9W9WR90_9EURO|nr:uncharacterized protein N7539_008693 [Penicillium diatomitis]KAJ5472124.1 hypothetical protein N7539_008693 [Penicillium diatomitis]
MRFQFGSSELSFPTAHDCPTLPALTMESSSVTALYGLLKKQLLKKQKSYERLIALLVSALSLKIGVDGLTLSAARRELIGLLLLPSFAFLYQFSTFSNAIPSSSVHLRHLAGQVTAVEPNTFDSLIESHSSTFKAGCKNYERNHGRKPPAHFDN